jgi:hypothetical protein
MTIRYRARFNIERSYILKLGRILAFYKVGKRQFRMSEGILGSKSILNLAYCRIL